MKSMMGLIGQIAALSLLEAEEGRFLSENHARKSTAQTNAVDPEAPVPIVESRQVRRQRERQARKGASS